MGGGRRGWAQGRAGCVGLGLQGCLLAETGVGVVEAQVVGWTGDGLAGVG